jgi:DMSO/TMAO reductase YedYZ heme-binding membrane subunit
MHDGMRRFQRRITRAIKSTKVGNFLIALVSLIISVTVLVLTVKFWGLDTDGLHQAVRYTIRFSTVLFVTLLLLDKLGQYAPRGLWRYLSAHRRGLGLGFACSIAVHLLSVYLFVTSGGYLPSIPALAMDVSAVILICFMALTSNDFMVRALGSRRWTILHRVGIYVIWFTLFMPFISRVRLDLHTYPYWCFSLLLIAAMSLRLSSYAERRNNGR